MTDRKQICVLGGTFNPIHMGHVRLGLYFARKLSLDTVLLMPSALPPHKSGGEVIPAVHRLAMCDLVAQEHPLFTVSDMEIRRTGKSYTVDTVRELRQRYPDSDISLIIGGDMLRTFHQWYCYEEILAHARILAAGRTIGEYSVLCEAAQQLRAQGGDVVVEDIRVIDVSSTQLRAWLREGNLRRAAAYLPQPVLQYIVEHCLYGYHKR